MTRFRQMRVICICMSFALLLLVIMTGCGKQTASQPSSPSAPATSPKDASQVIELTFNDHDPAVSTIAKAWMDWAKWVEEKSGGRIKINYVPGGALLKGNEVFRGVQSGVAHGGHYVVNRDDGFLLNLVVALPFMNMPAQKEAAEIYKQLLSKFPEMQAEWKGIKILGVIMMPPTQIHTTNKVVKTPQDIKGIRLHAAESIVSEAMSAAGASMVEMDIADMAMSLDRKLIQGVVNHFPVLGVFNALEKLPYHTVVGDGGINMTPMFAIMNADTFNKLPPDLQKVLEDSGRYWEEKQLEYDAGFQKSVMDFCKEKNHTFMYLTPEEAKVWYDLVKGPVHDKWIKECTDKGLPGKAVYDEAQRLIKERKAK